MPRRARLTIAFLAAHPGFSSARDGEAEAHVHVHLPRRHSSAVCCAGAPATVGTRASVLRPSQGWMRWMYMKGTHGWVKNSVDGWPLPAPRPPKTAKALLHLTWLAYLCSREGV